MKCSLTVAAAALFAFLPPGYSQIPAPRGPAALLYVRFIGAPGMRVAFYRDRAGPREFDCPVTVGLRPGYIYRVKITGIPGHPNLALSPTLEVRGSLYAPPIVNPAAHPAPLTLSETDLDHVLEGVFLTKVIYLEHPEKAFPNPTRPDQLLETTLAPDTNLWEAARDFGRPIMVLRLGERPAEETELRRQAIPGTILFPGEKGLMPAAVAPCLPWSGVQVYDPILGPRPPEEECLQDGGDSKRPAGIDAEGRVGGLDPSDTVAVYTDSQGRRQLARSNRVCLCVPRFAALRNETPLAGILVRTGPNQAPGVISQQQMGSRHPSLLAIQQKQAGAVRMHQRAGAAAGEQGLDRLVRLEVLDSYLVYQGPADLLGTPRVQQLTEVERLRLRKQVTLAHRLSEVQGLHEAVQTKGPQVVGRVEGLNLVSTTLTTADVTGICGEKPECLVDRPLLLIKWADRQEAQVGDLVTFYLKYSNNGSRPISDVAVSDSLTGRLEYIPSSAKSDRNAVFTLQENEAGSLVLRWEISGRLLPGESGKVSFQARIR